MSASLPSLKPREVIRILERNGFRRMTRRKKHRIYTDGNRIVPVPYHNHDLKPKTLKSIIRMAGWTIEDFLQKM
jgi:predicted RNA binding protein YcfA (HicA-like mRNA interferase family)